MAELIKNFSQLATSLARKVALEIMEAGLEAIQPQIILDARFRIQDSGLELGDKRLDLGRYSRIFLVGFGKGAGVIAKIIEEKLGERLTEGWVIDVSPARFTKIHFTLGTHPLPSETNVNFTRDVLAKLQGLTDKDLVLVVVCGGGSVLFTDPTVPIAKLVEINAQLLKSGKNITEMNRERKKRDRVKGGGLAERLKPAKAVGLIFSDVPGDDLATIASGPTVGSGAEDVLMVSNVTALEAMRKTAQKLGFEVEIYSDRIQGEAREVGKQLVSRIVGEKENRKVLLAGGETTVTARGNGEGGRNQELVLAVVQELGSNWVTNSNSIVAVSVGTDGWDNTPVAGAIADHQTYQTSQTLGLDINEFLKNNDSYHFFQKVGDFVDTGRLPMNVADLMVFLRYG